ADEFPHLRRLRDDEQDRLLPRARAFRPAAHRRCSRPAISRTSSRTFVDCVTTNKTDFFREPAHFDLLRIDD
ncbi:hypothetical protein CTI14_71290, partial [Methylobacterium radiotolerans]